MNTNRISDPSNSIEEINVPEIENLQAEFVYNFYVRDERVNPYASSSSSESPQKSARYVFLRWSSPPTSKFESEKKDSSKKQLTVLSDNADKIMSEDHFFNPGFVCHTFSNIESIEQGSSDLEKYSLMTGKYIASLSKISKDQVVSILASTGSYEQSGEIVDAYTKLGDFPKDALGLRVYDDKNQPIDDDSFLRSITNSLSLSVKINDAVIPDIFNMSKMKSNRETYDLLSRKFLRTKLSPSNEQNIPVVSSEQIDKLENSYPNKYVGYVIDRFSLEKNGLKKEKTFYINDIRNTEYYDYSVLYGKTYIYKVRIIASFKIATYGVNQQPAIATIYVASRSTSCPVECYEYIPPPMPNDIKFTFDYVKRNLIITWDTPVNPQRDIKQFQVFRRKNIKSPFELIAQYSFDDTYENEDASRYKTGEKVDGNSFDEMNEDFKYLVRLQDNAVYAHRDEDFTVDTEFFISSDYIYAICSIDAHGMISNYSSQHRVIFDPYKNRLNTQIVCDAGSPRQYPNMNLRTDAFKDAINVSGDNSRQMTVYCTPEYLKVKDDRGLSHQIIAAQTPQNGTPYYVLQMINLDNQKSQTVKIEIKDPQNLTS